jgi:hypothetical protein
MQAVNFALFLWGSDSEVENRWRHVLPGNMEATVREWWFQPLREMLDRVERERKSGELGRGEEGVELGMVEGELAVLRGRLERLEGAGGFRVKD